MHINSDGSLDTGWTPNPSGTVKAIGVSGSDVYLGGNFTITDGVHTRNNAAHIHAGALDPNWNPNPNGTVNAIALSGSRVYLGGSFTTIGSQAASNAARVDNGLGTLDTGWTPNPSGTVKALAVAGTAPLETIYLGGSFAMVGGQALSNAARVSDAGTVDIGWNPNPDNTVNALAVTGSGSATTVYLGGSFTAVKGQVITTSGVPRNTSPPPATRHNAAAVDNAGAANGWNPSPNGAVDAIATLGSTVYIGGNFNAISGPNGTVGNAAGLDTFNGYNDGWNSSFDDTVFALAVPGSNIYLGGQVPQRKR